MTHVTFTWVEGGQDSPIPEERRAGFSRGRECGLRIFWSSVSCYWKKLCIWAPAAQNTFQKKRLFLPTVKPMMNWRQFSCLLCSSNPFLLCGTGSLHRYSRKFAFLISEHNPFMQNSADTLSEWFLLTEPHIHILMLCYPSQVPSETITPALSRNTGIAIDTHPAGSRPWRKQHLLRVCSLE